jgi:hypothetical protein
VSKNQNQNDVGEVAKWLGILDEVADSAGVKEIILSAHTGWNGERTRGSSGLHDWPDVIVTMKIEDGDRFLSAEGRDVQLAESQLLWFPEHRHLRMVPGNRATVKAEKKLGGLVDAVVEIVTETPGLGTNEIVTVLKNQGSPARRADIGAALNRACGRGLIEVRLEANRKQAHYLTDAATVVAEGSK